MGSMKQGAKYNYEVRKSRWKHPGHTTVEVVKGSMAAENMVERLNRDRSEKEIADGWHYASYRTTAAVTKKATKSTGPARRTGRR